MDARGPASTPARAEKMPVAGHGDGGDRARRKRQARVETHHLRVCCLGVPRSPALVPSSARRRRHCVLHGACATAEGEPRRVRETCDWELQKPVTPSGNDACDQFRFAALEDKPKIGVPKRTRFGTEANKIWYRSEHVLVSKQTSQNRIGSAVIGRVRNQISQSLSRGVLGLAWRFFRKFPRLFTRDVRLFRATPAHATFHQPHPKLNNGLHCLLLHRLGRRPQGVQGPGTCRAMKHGREPRVASPGIRRRIRGPRAERRAWPGARGRAAGPRRARIDSNERHLDSCRRGRAFAAASGGGGRVPVATDAGNISPSTASAVFPDTPSRPEPVADAFAPFPFVSAGQVCVQGHQGRHLPRVRHLPRRWRVPHHPLRLREERRA